MKQPLTKDTIKLFIRFQNDFNNYKKNQKEKEDIFTIPKDLTELLHELLRSDQLTQLLITNGIINQESKQKKKENKDKLLSSTVKSKTFKDGDCNQDNDDIYCNNKRGLNPSSYNQRCIETIPHFYHSINETMILKQLICDTMAKFTKNTIEQAIEKKYGRIPRGDNFILRNKHKSSSKKKNKQAKSKLKHTLKEGYEMNSTSKDKQEKKFISYSEYIKKGKLGLDTSQYGLLMRSQGLKLSLKNDIKKRNQPKKAENNSYYTPTGRANMYSNSSVTHNHSVISSGLKNNNNNNYLTQSYNSKPLPVITSPINSMQTSDNNTNIKRNSSKVLLRNTHYPMDSNLNIKEKLNKRLLTVKNSNLSLDQRARIYTTSYDYSTTLLNISQSKKKGSNRRKVIFMNS